MNIKLNNNINASQLITFTNVPTIVKIDSNGSGTKSKLTITIQSGGVTLGTTYLITINDVTISSTFNEQDAIGNVWWVATNANTNYQYAMAYYIQQALLNTSLANNYNIYFNDNIVTVEAKEIGSEYDFTVFNSTLSAITFNVETEGSSSDLLSNSRIIMKLYAQQDSTNNINASAITLPHVVTLDKYYYKDGISFDIAPILANITENNQMTEYNVSLHYIKDGQLTTIGTLNHNYCVNGYSVNQGLYYIPPFESTYLAQNVSRGSIKDTYNNSILYYIDGEPITLSFFNSDLSSKTFTINYYDSAMGLIDTNDIIFTPTKTLDTLQFNPNEGAYYVDVVTNQGKIRYTNIKPINYINNDDLQVIYFNNSYGGVSFIPLSFDRQEEREVEYETYTKQSFDIYDSGVKELDKVYSKHLEYTVELKSHFIRKDGTYIFNDLLHSYNAWTYINGIKYLIIITNVQISETNVNDIYQATVTYKYSLSDVFY